MRQTFAVAGITRVSQAFQSFERDRQVGAALVAGEGMQFVDDDELRVAQMHRVIFLREHDGEAFRGRDEKVRRLTSKLCAFGCGRVARAQMYEQFLFQSHAGNRRLQVLADVVGERAQRGDIDALHAVCERALIEFSQKEIKDTEKTGEGFAAAGRGREKDRFAIKNRRDAAQLCIGKDRNRSRETIARGGDASD